MRETPDFETASDAEIVEWFMSATRDELKAAFPTVGGYFADNLRIVLADAEESNEGLSDGHNLRWKVSA